LDISADLTDFPQSDAGGVAQMRVMDATAGVAVPQDASPTLESQLDALPVTPLHWAIVVVCALGLMFDVIEAALSNALSAVFSAPPHRVPQLQLSLLLGSVFAGGAIGAPLLGLLADRYGRRLALGAALLVLAATSLLAAASTDIVWLTFFRTLSGLALGAYPVLMVAYLSDVLPPARRGRMILLCGAIGFLGAPAVVFLMRALTPLAPLGFEGWRWALVIGAVGSVAVGVAFRWLPESPRWLVTAGRRTEAEAVFRRFARSAGRAAPQVHIGERLAEKRDSFWSAAGRRHRARAALLTAMYFLSPWATVGFPLLSGAVLVEKGFRVADSLLYLGVTMFGPTLGVLAGAFVIDRVERRTALVLTAGTMALLGLAFAASNDPVTLMVLGLAFTLIGAAYVAVITVYDAELFPTAMRASVSSSTWAANRIASALAPLALLPLLKSHGALVMFGVIAAALAVSIVLLLAFGPRGLARRPVE
jgi:MFS transporter, putative metabolite:H+ symporter